MMAAACGENGSYVANAVAEIGVLVHEGETSRQAAK